MFRFLDKNPTLGKILAGISTTLAYQRGLPMVIGTVLVVVSWIVTGIVMIVLVAAADVETVWLLLCLPATLLHLGVLSGFIGMMMAVPLGQGYKE